jgi:propanol-preferring alcohol dehydrogenase
MKAWQLIEKGRFRPDRLDLREVDRPVPDDDELLIKVHACGICHTDLHVIEADIDSRPLPLTLGHQVVGEVARANGDSSQFEVGDRVGVPWLHQTCGTCPDCRNDRENLCRNAVFTGCDTHGGFAEFMTVPAPFAHPVPDGLDPVQAAPLLCGGVVGYRALRLSNATSGDRLGLYGFGSSASIVIQAAIHKGCECYVFTRSEDHMELAESLGAVWTGRAQEDPGAQMNSSILFAPAGSLVPPALDQLRQGGTLAIAGIYLSPIPELDYEQHLYRERTVKSVTASTRQDVRDFLDLAEQIPVETATETVPFDRLPDGLQRMNRSKHNASPVLQVSESA